MLFQNNVKHTAGALQITLGQDAGTDAFVSLCTRYARYVSGENTKAVFDAENAINLIN